MSNDVMDRVIDGGFCIGCGACAFAQPASFRMTFTEIGTWRADRIADATGTIAELCPMSGEGRDETLIAQTLYPDLPVHASVGRHLACGVGWVEEGEYRTRGGSGGLLTWVLVRLLQEGLVDAVMHVRAKPFAADGDLLFEYQISHDVGSVGAAAKSRYYPIEMSEALRIVRDSDKRFAIVGLPCFLKAVRNLQHQGLLDRDRTPFLVGMICGHLKSAFFAELLAWQTGVRPEDLSGIDFRVKLADGRASAYGFAVAARAPGTTPTSTVHPMSSVLGRDWGEGLMKYVACEFCDDVLAECADIAVGDAWLPGYVDDPKGTSVFVVRSPVLRDIVDRGAAGGALKIDTVSADVAAQSQSSGLRHRREGLAYRLTRMKREGLWAPRKRVAPNDAIPPGRRAVYDHRYEIARAANPLFAEARRRGDLSHFIDGIMPLVSRYRQQIHLASKPGLRARIARRLRGAMRTLIQR